MNANVRDMRVEALEAAVESRTRDLQAALEERTALHHELDHRVKNNLQLISSLMAMQARRATDTAVRTALGGMAERLHAIALVHRRLFQSEDVKRFDLSEFVRDLAAEVMSSAGRPDVKLDYDLAPASAPAASAAVLALLIHELLFNAVRHGFPDGRGGQIHVAVGETNGVLRIEIADDGVGMSGLSGGADGAGQGFGLTIVDLLSRQLQATIRRETPGRGVRTVVTLPLETHGGGVRK